MRASSLPPRRLSAALLMGAALLLSADPGSAIGPTATQAQLVDANPGPGGSVLEAVALVQGNAGGRELLALAPDGVAPGLWSTDGTAAGTAPLAVGTLEPFDPLGLAAFAVGEDVALVRASGDEVWWVRPASGTVRRLGEMAASGDSFAWPLGAAVGGTLVFRGRGSGGEELWRTDGTAAGTVRVADLVAGAASSYPGAFVPFGERVAFQATSAGAGGPDAVWSTDGTAAGTHRLLRVPEAFVVPLAGTASRLVFRVLGATASEEGIWGSNGQADNATRLIALAPTAGVQTESLPGQGLLVASHDPGGTARLWLTDGTVAGTRLLHQEAVEDDAKVILRVPASEAGGATPRVLAIHEKATGWRFEATDGTSEGTTPFLLPLGPEHDGSNPPILLGSDGKGLYWAFSDGTFGGEPWVTDLQGLGAVLVGDLCPDECASDPYAPRALAAGGLSFSASVEGDAGLFFTEAEDPVAFPLLEPGAVDDVLYATAAGYLGPRTTAASGTEPWSIAVSVPCTPDATTHCLNGGRFAVTASWATKADGGEGRVFPLTDDTGAFWFFGPENLEIVVKVLRACRPPFESYWVFASGLTDVGVELTVTDSTTGRTRVYSNALGESFTLVKDLHAFPCP